MIRVMTPETQIRVRTGIVGGLVFLGLLLYGGMLGITFITAVITIAMVWELCQIFFTLHDKLEKRKAMLGAAWLMVFINFLAPKSMVECVIAGAILFFAYYLATANRHDETLREHFLEFCYSCFILIYPVSFMVFLPMIRGSVHGLHWTVLLFLIVWAGDTGAYFAGRRFQGQKLYPAISPGKTVSGALGGLASGLVITIVYKLTLFRDMGWLAMLVVPVFVGVTAQIGDLCESFLKRAYRIKDMSQMLPGHGGMLDRFDGVLFALPVMYFCMKALG